MITPGHTQVCTTETFIFGWRVLLHPPYNPDLTPLDFHLSGSLEDDLQGYHYAENDEWQLVRGGNTSCCYKVEE
jgi:hypothetical protein